MSAIKRVCAFGIAALILSLPAQAGTGARYSTDQVELGTFKRTTTLDGEIQYLETQGLFVTDPDATLGEILVATDDAVKAGQAIATYTVTVSGTVEKQAEIDLSEAKDDYAYECQSRTDEIDSLHAQLQTEADTTSAHILELQIARAELTYEKYRADAEANIASLTTAYEKAQAADEPRTLNAGISGVVYSVAQDPAGSSIDSSKMLAALYNPEKVLVRVDNSEGALRYGMEVEVRLSGWSTQTTAKGTVVSADNVLPGELRTGYAYVAYDASSKGGAYTSAQVVAITMSMKNALIVSSQAVSFDDEKSFVRILGADGTVHTRYVVKAMDSGSDVWIAQGVSEGDKLIAK